MLICKTCQRKNSCDYPCEKYSQTESEKKIKYKEFLAMLKNNNMFNFGEFTLLPYQIEMLERVKNGKY